MKTNPCKHLASKAQHLAFIFAWLLLVGGGWWAKTAVDQFAAVQDEIQRDLAFPSPVFLESIAKERTSTAPEPSKQLSS